MSIRKRKDVFMWAWIAAMFIGFLLYETPSITALFPEGAVLAARQVWLGCCFFLVNIVAIALADWFVKYSLGGWIAKWTGGASLLFSIALFVSFGYVLVTQPINSGIIAANFCLMGVFFFRAGCGYLGWKKEVGTQ